MAMASLSLIIILISFENICCYIPELHPEVTTQKDVYLKNHENSFEDSSDDDTNLTNSDENDPEGPLDHEIPYSEHEHPKDIATRPNYTTPGKWARPPAEKNITLEFIPKKLYAQVRASHTIKRVPQEEAIEAAETKEEKEDAARLREVVTNSKVATVYTEEGYEDSAYDHGGHAKGADFHEDYARKLHDELDHNGNYKKHPDESSENEELLSQEEEKSFEDELKDSQIHPKLVTQEGIAQLESEVNHSNAEAEKGSEIYGAEKLKKDNHHDNVNLLERRMFLKSDDDSIAETDKNLDSDEKIAPVYTVRPRKKPDTRTKSSQSNVKASKKRKKFNIAVKDNTSFPKVTERYEETTRLKPGHTLVTELPTTVDYSNTFWNYFKERQNQRAGSQPKIEESTFHPNTITVKSINGHGPYLKVIDNDNDATRHPLENIVTSDFIDNTANNPIADSSDLPKSDQTLQSTGNGEIVSHILYPDMNFTTESLSPDDTNYLTYSSTPISYPISPLGSNIFSSQQQKTHFDHNPFLVHFARSAKNKIPRYTVLVRPQAVHSGREISYESPNTAMELTQLKGVVGNKRYPIIPTNKKHALLRNQRKLYPVKNKVNALSTQDLIFLKPPPPPMFREITYSGFLPHSSVSAMDHSTMTDKSRRLEESGHRPFADFLENPFVANSAELQKNLDSISSRRFPARPLRTIQNEELINTLFLSPPTPFSRSEYAQYNIRRKRNARLKKKLGVVSSPNFVVVKSRNKRSSKPFENLFNESPKVVDKVIDKELEKRFENKSNNVNYRNPNSINNKRENIEIEIPEFEYEDKFDDDNIFNISTTSEMVVDAEKYPFYKNVAVPSFSALKYSVNPKRIPKKTFGGMEFYNSRNSLRCDEVDPNLENVVPPEEEPVDNRGLKEDLPRLQGLGDKLDCFKAKYFGENPLDNPIFSESLVEQPTQPLADFNTNNFAVRLLNLPSNKENYISLQISKKPESEKSTQINKPRFRSYQNGKPAANKNRSRGIQNQSNLKIPKQLNVEKKRIEGDSSRSTPYLAEVYQDVMGTIRNLGYIHDKGRPKSPSTMTGDRNFLRYVTDSSRQKVTENPFIHITNKPFELLPLKIEGLVPPSEGTFPRTTPQKNRMNRMIVENNSRVNGDGYYRALQLKKRSIRSTDLPNNINHKKFMRSINDWSSRLSPSRSGETFNKTSSTIHTIPVSVGGKRRSRVVKSAFTGAEANIPSNGTKRIVYTIHDKIGNLKPRDELGMYGNFTKKLISSNIDSRRQKLNYNPIIMNEKLPSIELSKIVPPYISSNLTMVELGKQGFKWNQTHNEQRKAAAPDTRNSSAHEKRGYTDLAKQLNEDQDKSDTNSQYSKEIEKDPVDRYDVHEDLSEEKPYSALLKYLESDPPGYDEMFGEDDDSTKGDQDSSKLNNGQKRKDTNDKSDYKYDDGSEDSREYLEDSASEVEDEENNEDQSSEKSENSKEDDKKFERFDSRPFSPYENFDDDEYSELGPRIHKPAFYHPPFIVPEYESSYLGRTVPGSNSDETEESDDEDKYSDDEDDSKEEEEEEEIGEETRNLSRLLQSYESPWKKGDESVKKGDVKRKES